MPSLVLLDSKGLVVRKLQFVSLPDDYVAPEGMTISWRFIVQMWLYDAPMNYRHVEPIEAHFSLGSARGQACRSEVKEYERDHSGTIHYCSRILTITVQGISAKDVMGLRDRIMHFIDTGTRWEVSNDLNPKPKVGLLRRLLGAKAQR
jgi:hypothetical protein